MERYLICLDVDGTLVGDSLVLSSYTKDVLRRLGEMGHVVVLASGRPWRSMKPYYEELGLTGPVVTYNGAHAFFPLDESLPSYERRFPRESVKDICERLTPLVDSLFVDLGHRSLLLCEDDYIDNFFPYKGVLHGISNPMGEIPEDAYVLLFKRKEVVDDPYEGIVESHPPLRYRAWRDSPYAEAYIQGVDKGSALAFLLETLHWPLNRTIAVGDSDNDLPMLRLVPNSYRMPESTQASLKRFPSCPDTAENDGVAKLLEKLLLGA